MRSSVPTDVPPNFWTMRDTLAHARYRRPRDASTARKERVTRQRVPLVPLARNRKKPPGSAAGRNGRAPGSYSPFET
jgi:hypothetical protein